MAKPTALTDDEVWGPQPPTPQAAQPLPAPVPFPTDSLSLAARRAAWDVTVADLRVRLAAWLAQQPEVTRVGDWDGCALPLVAENDNGEFGVAILLQ